VYVKRELREATPTNTSGQGEAQDSWESVTERRGQVRTFG
jgi:hypothetical protein